MELTQYQNRIIGHDYINPKDITLNPNNPRQHSQEQSELMREIFTKIGWIQDVIINSTTGHLIDGELRVKDAIDHGEEGVPVVYVELSEEEELEVLLVYDEVARLATSNKERMKSIVLASAEQSARMKDLISDIVKRNKIDLPQTEQPQSEDDEEEEEQTEDAEPVSETGNIWKLDESAYIVCGDCTNKDVITSLIKASGFRCIHNVMTSPPYAEQRVKQYGGIKEKEYVSWFGGVQENAKMFMDAKGNFFLNIKPNTEKDGQRTLYVFDLVTAMVRNYRWYFIDEFCWIKQSMPKQVTRHFKNAFEPVYQFSLSTDFLFFPDNVKEKTELSVVPLGKGAGDTSWDGEQGHGGRNISLNKSHVIEPGMAFPDNVIYAKQMEHTGHEATYPVSLVDFFVKAYSENDMVWLDPFAGSGTTGISARMNGRKCLMIEREPKYVDLILNRWKSRFNCEPERIK